MRFVVNEGAMEDGSSRSTTLARDFLTAFLRSPDAPIAIVMHLIAGKGSNDHASRLICGESRAKLSVFLLIHVEGDLQRLRPGQLWARYRGWSLKRLILGEKQTQGSSATYVC